MMSSNFPSIDSLELQRAYLASIIDSSDDAIVGKDLTSIVTSWNFGAERIFGYSAAEMIGQSITRLIPTARLGEEDEILRRIRAGDRIDHFETVRLRKDGTEIDVSVTVSAIKNSEGKVVGASKIARDVTMLKQLERDRAAMLEMERTLREKAERADRVKDDFLATLSHELRTPLSAILGWVEILREEGVSDVELKEGLDVIHRNCHAQSQLVDDLLDINRILMGKVRLDVANVDLPQVVEQSIQAVMPAAESKKVSVVAQIDPLAGPVRGDAARLQQVVWNLLTNAIKFTPPDGSVEVMLRQEGRNALLHVKDSGIGIRAEFLTSIFDRFSQLDSSTTRRYAGLGLGLSIVKHLVELQGGSVRAESGGEGLGATFHLTLPLQSETSRPAGSAASPAPEKSNWTEPDLKGCDVLLVEDDLDNAHSISRLLERCGARVTRASSGMQALAFEDFSRFDLVISDIGMPDMDGLELMRQIRGFDADRGGRVPSIALTAFSRPEDRKSAILAGFDNYLSKPADPQELVAMVDRFAHRGNR